MLLEDTENGMTFNVLCLIVVDTSKVSRSGGIHLLAVSSKWLPANLGSYDCFGKGNSLGCLSIRLKQ